jgi:hypothetical protein
MIAVGASPGPVTLPAGGSVPLLGSGCRPTGPAASMSNQEVPGRVGMPASVRPGLAEPVSVEPVSVELGPVPALVGPVSGREVSG